MQDILAFSKLQHLECGLSMRCTGFVVYVGDAFGKFSKVATVESVCLS